MSKHTAKPCQVIQGVLEQPTCIHFGIDMAPHPDQSVVLIQQESQYVLIEQHTWPDLKATIDEYYETLQEKGTIDEYYETLQEKGTVVVPIKSRETEVA